ncbi:MAG: extracellular solute-binding protein [Aestuariivita sp.]|nr:extracellular solute-binding protein [Aestuariivita sp.]MCY4201086.1 extracellular solute-binding protein [Aestuariivita sp.]MCY4288272.1 extracellular solute-binding protein [Aestuariivita sp.]MCY4345917.1 extracellular solute-binding protein [Aestuariivita sp.]
MYGQPALPSNFQSLPYVNPDAPQGGKIVLGNVGAFDSLNPFVSKGAVPWQLRFLSYESLMGRSMDEPFSLYGLLAETIRTPEDRSWVEFTLRDNAKFWDGTPVTLDDVIWSFETLGEKGHLRYRNFWSQVEAIEAVGPKTVRISFKNNNRELALLAGLRPILKKAQWRDSDFESSGTKVPIGTGSYIPRDFELGRFLELVKNPDYWGADLPLVRGTQNFNVIRIEFFGDQAVLFEAFKAGELSALREFNSEKWRSAYDFPAVSSGDVIKSEIPHGRPSGMTGLVMNSRQPPFDDWRVREAMILAFNFEFINETITGAEQSRISSYFSNSQLAMRPGSAQSPVLDLLLPFEADLLPGTLEGYSLPKSDGTERNRRNLRKAINLLHEAGWRVENGVLQNNQGLPFAFNILLRQGEKDYQAIVDIYSNSLNRLGIQVDIETVDDAQYNQRINALDFDITGFRRDLSLSPGNEQKLYWGSELSDVEGTRNLMGVSSPAVDATIDRMLQTTSATELQTAVRALDRLLIAGRFVIPIWRIGNSRIAHKEALRYPKTIPLYGDRGSSWFPHVWWYEEN